MNLLNQLLSEMSIVLKGIISAVRSFHIDNGFADPLSKAEVLFFLYFPKTVAMATVGTKLSVNDKNYEAKIQFIKTLSC